MSAAKRVQQWATFARTWHVFDCKWQDPYESAPIIKKYLMGMHKPIYHPMNDCGDVVVCINSKQIALKGDDWRQRAYFHHTGYPGGASWTLAWELHNKDPTMHCLLDGNCLLLNQPRPRAVITHRIENLHTFIL
ncbi:39S ribosomal protein L13, mitochondrial isoform X2 [Hyposmocoma kahamanoa]|uniref:39S ribosomal protein L13, mitochondrial isoform X2 n=1 Tax=Hyposmocoma kahamanoa TaxID=1477025 RepID=UPI000E6D85D8|nr:39S ribosomal protein L13, mitochondrial isoform X2 [Hyposmocoma kahamanoa]